MVAAAKELGYSISLAALERAKAEAEELDPEALNEAAGGSIDWCIKEYECALTYITNKEDQDGHNMFCFTAWHCFTAVVHTERV